MQITSNDALNQYLIDTRDSTAANQTLGKNKIAYYYRQALAETLNYTSEMTRFFNSKALQRSYILPKNLIKPKSFRFFASNFWVTLDEESVLDKWNARKAVDIYTVYPSHYHVYEEQGMLYVELDPIPSTDGTNNIEVVFEGYQTPLTFVGDVTSGTLTIDPGANAATNQIVASVNVFTQAMVGLFVQITGDSDWYEILSVTDGMHASLVQYYQKGKVINSTYRISEVLRIPDEFDYTPVWGADKDYYLPINWRKAQDFLNNYNADLAVMHKKYQNKTKGAVTPGMAVSVKSSYIPRNYPKSSLTRG